MKVIFALLFFVSYSYSKIETCPPCNSCQTCDTKRGTCVPANQFSSCSTNSYCYNGACTLDIIPPLTQAPPCKFYECTPGSQCNLLNHPDGTDCTPVSSIDHHFCVNTQCKPFVEGLTKAGQNAGCWYRKNKAPCDTNLDYTDNEECFANVCQKLPIRLSTVKGEPLPRGQNCLSSNPGGECSLLTSVTPDDMPFHVFCFATKQVNGNCFPVIDALTGTVPDYNSGCWGYREGTLCDTNGNTNDGERCNLNVCKFPDGSYNGVLP